MDYEAIRIGLESGVPFDAHVGLQAVSVASGEAVVRLPDEGYLLNHVGTKHGSAMFTAAEAASGAAVFGAFADEIERYMPMAQRGEISYLQVARGVLEAQATMLAKPGDVIEELERSGGARFEVSVELTDAGGAVVARAVRLASATQRTAPGLDR